VLLQYRHDSAYSIRRPSQLPLRLENPFHDRWIWDRKRGFGQSKDTPNVFVSDNEFEACSLHRGLECRQGEMEGMGHRHVLVEAIRVLALAANREQPRNLDVEEGAFVPEASHISQVFDWLWKVFDHVAQHYDIEWSKSVKDLRPAMTDVGAC
jgi:hypothetical protein